MFDTIGYDGQNLIEPVGVDHRVSPAFHLVERWERSTNGLDLSATYYDEMVWGSKPWGELQKTFILRPKMEVVQAPCSLEDNKKFDDRFTHPTAPAL